MSTPAYFNTIVALAQAINRTEDPEEANSLLGGAIIANLVGHIKEDQWRRMRMVIADPCDRPGCNCEIIRNNLMEALDATREDWKENVEEMSRLRLGA